MHWVAGSYAAGLQEWGQKSGTSEGQNDTPETRFVGATTAIRATRAGKTQVDIVPRWQLRWRTTYTPDSPAPLVDVTGVVLVYRREKYVRPGHMDTPRKDIGPGRGPLPAPQRLLSCLSRIVVDRCRVKRQICIPLDVIYLGAK